MLVYSAGERRKSRSRVRFRPSRTKTNKAGAAGKPTGGLIAYHLGFQVLISRVTGH
jgi:hypothetical protein